MSSRSTYFEITLALAGMFMLCVACAAQRSSGRETEDARARHGVESAFDQCAAAQQDVKGIFLMRIELAKDGRVQSAKLESDHGAADSTFAKCVEDKVATLKFAPPMSKPSIAVKLHTRGGPQRVTTDPQHIR